MAQGQKQYGTPSSTKSLNSNNPRQLAPNQKIVKRDGGVYLQTHKDGGDFDERRIDSPRDADTRSKDGEVWWDALYAQQEAAMKPVKSKKKETSDE